MCLHRFLDTRIYERISFLGFLKFSVVGLNATLLDFDAEPRGLDGHMEVCVSLEKPYRLSEAASLSFRLSYLMLLDLVLIFE